MSMCTMTMALLALAALSGAACSTTGERLGGAVVGGVAGAVAGPAVATDTGVPHRRYRRLWRRRHHDYHP
jgi:hypothetical protein